MQGGDPTLHWEWIINNTKENSDFVSSDEVGKSNIDDSIVSTLLLYTDSTVENRCISTLNINPQLDSTRGIQSVQDIVCLGYENGSLQYDNATYYQYSVAGKVY